jgi:hypothetical protein
MKQINVICNNIKEFQFLAECIQWILSKQNMRYKSGREFIIDISNQTKYVFVREHTYSADCNECIWLCKEKDNISNTLKMLSNIELLKLSIKVVLIHNQYHCVINEVGQSSDYLICNQKISDCILKIVNGFDLNNINDVNEYFLKMLPPLLYQLNKLQYLSSNHTLIELRWIDGCIYYTTIPANV